MAGPMLRILRPEKVFADIGASSFFSGSSAALFFAIAGVATSASTINRIQNFLISFPSSSD
jgi:hypothetical protein